MGEREGEGEAGAAYVKLVNRRIANVDVV